MKTICAKILGDGNPELKDVALEEGTTAPDIRRALNIPESYRAYRRSTNEYLNENADLHQLLNESEKVEFVPESHLGSWREKISLSSIFSRGKKHRTSYQKVRVLSTMSLPPPTASPGKAQDSYPVIKGNPNLKAVPAEKLGIEAELENMGWTRNGNDFLGTIKGNYAVFNCMLRKHGRKFELYIQNPPPGVLSGRHSACFHFWNNGWYHAHFSRGKNPISRVASLQEYVRQVGG